MRSSYVVHIVAGGLGLLAGYVALYTAKGGRMHRQSGTRKGMPAFPFFMFGVVGLLASAGDARVIRSDALRGASRLARHLWRMSFALFIAALSFFIGQARRE